MCSTLRFVQVSVLGAAYLLCGLAEKVQQEVYHVLPQAEGTASWDGFGARASSLR